MDAEWLSRAADQAKTWVMPGSGLVIGIDRQGRVDLGCVNGSEPLGTDRLIKPTSKPTSTVTFNFMTVPYYF